jgi:DNA-directed RNA polymerase subunit omega
MEAPTSSSFFLEETPMTIETSFDSNYRKVLVAARRARQLQNGSQALVPTRSNKACRIAQDEIDAGKIAYVKNNQAEVVKPLVEGPAVPILLS